MTKKQIVKMHKVRFKRAEGIALLKGVSNYFRDFVCEPEDMALVTAYPFTYDDGEAAYIVNSTLTAMVREHNKR